MSPVALFVRRELTGAVRARWFVAYAAALVLAGLLLVGAGAGDVTIAGYRGFAKAFGGLVHLAVLVVPLMALFPAIAAIADERESGALEYILAQPVTPAAVYAGKWSGVSAAVTLSLGIGLGTPGLVAILRGVPPGPVAILLAFALLLASVFVALGFLLAAATSNRARAATLGVITWLGLIALGTLGLMAAFVRYGVPASVLAAWSFVNPIEAFRLAIVSVLDPDLSLLGPVGAMLRADLGTGGIVTLAAASLTTWMAGAAYAGLRLFQRTS